MPYCRKCGKEIEQDTGLCEDCRNNELIFEEYEQEPATINEVNELETKQREQSNGRMFGFGKALVSTIVGVVSVVFAYIATVFVLLDEQGVAGYAVCLTFSIIGAIISLALGIISIMAFIRKKKEGAPKPIATLVCGIVGCVMAATAGSLWLTSFVSLLY